MRFLAPSRVTHHTQRAVEAPRHKDRVTLTVGEARLIALARHTGVCRSAHPDLPLRSQQLAQSARRKHVAG